MFNPPTDGSLVTVHHVATLERMTSRHNDTKISSLPTRNNVILISTATATAVTATALSTPAAPYRDYHIQLWLWYHTYAYIFDWDHWDLLETAIAYCYSYDLWCNCHLPKVMITALPAWEPGFLASTATAPTPILAATTPTQPIAYGYHHHIRAIMLQQRFLFWHSYCATTYHETAFMWRVWLLPHY